MIRALLFDMDGVLADSEDISIEIGIEYFESIGVKASAEDFAPYQGIGERIFFDGPAHDLNAENYRYEDASLFFRRRYPEIIKGRSIALPGTEFVRRARKAGLLTAVSSSAPSWKVSANIEGIGLKLSDFDSIASGEDIRRNKPEKDIYTLSMIRLGVGEEEAVVFEDSRGGIESGKKAGCRVVSMLTTISREEAERAGADSVIENLGVIPDFQDGDALENILFGGRCDSLRYGVNIIRRKGHYPSEKMVVEAARKARENGYAPYSGFRVGAAIVSASSGRIYSGCNVENSSYGATICAERNAITTAVAAEGKIGIECLAVYSDDAPPAPPCALCLQVIAEFARPETEVILVTPRTIRRYNFSQLLPMPFIFPTMR